MQNRLLSGLYASLTLALSASVFLPNHFQSQGTSRQVELQLVLEEKEFTLHEPVVVLFTVHNGLSTPIILTLGAEKRQYFQFSLTKPDGQVIHSSYPPPGTVDIVTFGSGQQEVASGETFRQNLLLNQWFQVDSRGKYVLNGRLTSKIEISKGQYLSDEDHTLSFHVGARDSSRLKKVCEELTNQIRNRPSVEEWQEPARMLSSIDDPIAVPYLAEVLSTHKGTENIIVPGLERIGDDPAVEALLSSLEDQSGDVSILARRALTRLEPTISNSHLKETVRRALAPKPVGRFERRGVFGCPSSASTAKRAGWEFTSIVQEKCWFRFFSNSSEAT